MKTRSFYLKKHLAGRTVAQILQSELQVSASTAKQHITDGRVRVDGKVCRQPSRRLNPGQRLQVAPTHKHSKTPPPTASGNHRIDILFSDADIVVVDKPAGLTTVRHAKENAEFGKRAKRFLPPTLTDLLPGILRTRQRLRPVHRLDKETTGILVFARNATAERHLGLQFRAHSIDRRYLALVRGQAQSDTIDSPLVRDRGDGRRGSGSDGQRAVTHVTLLEDFGDFSLVECRLETGRTHQVRIHLGEQGTPLCGERIYDRPLHGKPLPDDSNAGRPLLHASSLEIEHPTTGKRLSWRSRLPDDMKRLLRRLKKSRKRNQ